MFGEQKDLSSGYNTPYRPFQSTFRQVSPQFTEPWMGQIFDMSGLRFSGFRGTTLHFVQKLGGS